MIKAKRIFFWTSNLKGHGFNGDKAHIYLISKYYPLPVLSEKLYFLGYGHFNIQSMLKTLNSNFLDWEDTLKWQLMNWQNVVLTYIKKLPSYFRIDLKASVWVHLALEKCWERCICSCRWQWIDKSQNETRLSWIVVVVVILVSVDFGSY